MARPKPNSNKGRTERISICLSCRKVRELKPRTNLCRACAKSAEARRLMALRLYAARELVPVSAVVCPKDSVSPDLATAPKSKRGRRVRVHVGTRPVLLSRQKSKARGFGLLRRLRRIVRAIKRAVWP